jgi:hypothetical protein
MNVWITEDHGYGCYTHILVSYETYVEYRQGHFYYVGDGRSIVDDDLIIETVKTVSEAEYKKQMDECDDAFILWEERQREIAMAEAEEHFSQYEEEFKEHQEELYSRVETYPDSDYEE